MILSATWWNSPIDRQETTIARESACQLAMDPKPKLDQHHMSTSARLLLPHLTILLLTALAPSASKASSSSDNHHSHRTCYPDQPPVLPIQIHPQDTDPLQFALNLEFLECEFFLFAVHGTGLDSIAPELANGGPPPVGAMKASLDREAHRIIEEFGYQEIGHLRAIQKMVGGIPRPQLDIGPGSFAKIFDMALGYELHPPFNPYANSLNYFLAVYTIPYLGINGYVGANSNINGYQTKTLLAGLLGAESGQDAVVRKHLYDRAFEIVHPYNCTVAVFTRKLSMLRNSLAGCGIKDEGLLVPYRLGAENRTTSNVLSLDANSLAYPRTPAEILRVVYGTGDEHRPGGFYPEGGNGKIARQYL